MRIYAIRARRLDFLHRDVHLLESPTALHSFCALCPQSRRTATMPRCVCLCDSYRITVSSISGICCPEGEARSPVPQILIYSIRRPTSCRRMPCMASWGHEACRAAALSVYARLRVCAPAVGWGWAVVRRWAVLAPLTACPLALRVWDQRTMGCTRGAVACKLAAQPNAQDTCSTCPTHPSSKRIVRTPVRPCMPFCLPPGRGHNSSVGLKTTTCSCKVHVPCPSAP